MADCFSLPGLTELLEELERLLSLNDDNLAALILRNNDVQNAIIYAGDAIEALLAENAKLKAERDVAIADLEMALIGQETYPCKYCKRKNAITTCDCWNEQDGYSRWKWRGIKEEEDETD